METPASLYLHPTPSLTSQLRNYIQKLSAYAKTQWPGVTPWDNYKSIPLSEVKISKGPYHYYAIV